MEQVHEALDLAAARWEAIGPGDDEDAYEPIWLALGPVASMADAIDVAARRLGSATPADVCVALDLLSVVANGAEDSTVDRVATALLAAPRRRPDGSPLNDDVAWSLAHALGKLWRPEGAVALADLADHPDPDVRLLVASGITGGVEHDDAALERTATGVLLGLITDVDGDVRDWATFGLGEQLTADGPEVRDALAANLMDPFGDVADKALKGLARRHDRRALAPTLIRLEGDTASRQVFAAAALLAADRLALALAAWPLDEDVEAATVQAHAGRGCRGSRGRLSACQCPLVRVTSCDQSRGCADRRCETRRAMRTHRSRNVSSGAGISFLEASPLGSVWLPSFRHSAGTATMSDGSVALLSYWLRLRSSCWLALRGRWGQWSLR